MIAAVVPTRDELDLEGFVESVGRRVDRVLVVDDSATEAGREAAYGEWDTLDGVGSLGGSVLAGLGWWLDPVWNMDRVVTIDAGWSHTPAQIRSLLDVDADVVIGSRFVAGGEHRGPWWRQWGSRLFGTACFLRTGNGVKDWTSGFRAYSRRAVEHLARTPIRAQRHGFQAEVLASCINAGLKVKEVPIVYAVMPGSSLNRAAVREAAGVWRRLSWV